MPNPFVFNFDLRQHTPLIHFLHDQPGATIRATEIKPKLDAFIFKRLLASKNITSDLPPSFAFNKAIEQFPEWKHYLIGTGNAEHAALDYKLIIAATLEDIDFYNIGDTKYSKHEQQNVWDKQFPTFFANMGTEEQLRFFSYTSKPLSCKIKCINTALLEDVFPKMEAILSDFFLTHNFGMRQSKGFGSFTLSRFENRIVIPDVTRKRFVFDVPSVGTEKDIALFEANRYRTRSSRYLHSNWFNLFHHIDLFYRTLRSGINLPNQDNPNRAFYFKSLMFQWAKARSTPEIWDKKTIRLFFFGGGNGEEKHKEFQDIETRANFSKYPYPADGTFKYVPEGKNEKDGTLLFRDLLGLATEQEWGKYSNNTIKKEVKDQEGNTLSRFKSPYLFKPIYDEAADVWRVVIVVSPIPNSYLGATATISATKRKGKLPLKLPETFSPEEYLQWAIDYFRNHEHEGFTGLAQQEDRPEYEKISNIYNNITL